MPTMSNSTVTDMQIISRNGETNKHVERQKCLNSLFKPIMFSMKLFGLYFDNNKKTKFFHSFFGQKSYSVLTVMILWLNLIRYIPAFFVGIDFNPNLTVFRIIVFTWFTLGTLNATAIFYGCQKCMPVFRIMWYDLHCSGEYSKLHLDTFLRKQNVRKNVIIWTLFGCSVTIFNVITTLFMMFGPFPAARDTYGSLLCSPAPQTPWFQCITVVFYIYNTAAWILPVAYMNVMCLAIGSEFAVISNALESELTKSATKMLPTLEYIRKLHNKVCRLMCCIDKVMSLWIMNTFILNIPIACFIQYTLVYEDLDVLTFCVELYWLLGCMFNVIIVAVATSKVLTKAHSPLEHIHGINLSGATHEELGQLNLFLSKLNGPPIGFTAMGLITVTKEVILTLAGLYLTYFFLLLQFKI